MKFSRKRIDVTLAPALTLLLFVAGACSYQANSANGQTAKGAIASPSAAATRSLPAGLESEPRTESSWFGNHSVWISALALGFALIAAVGAGLFIQALRLRGRLDALEMSHLKTSRSLRKDGERDLEFVRKSFERLSAFEDRLNQTEKDMQGWNREMRSSQIATSYEGQIREALPSYTLYSEESELRFPVAVEECLASLRSSAVKTMSATALAGRLIEAEKGQFLLVLGDSFERPLLIIPSVVRFMTKQDYYNSFAEFYHCDKVTSGEVWILEPALANRIQGGWSLGEKGRLEIR